MDVPANNINGYHGYHGLSAQKTTPTVGSDLGAVPLKATEAVATPRPAYSLSNRMGVGGTAVPTKVASPGAVAPPLMSRPKIAAPPTSTMIQRLRVSASVVSTPIYLGILTFLIILGGLLYTKPWLAGADIVDEAGNSSRKANIKMCFWVAAAAGTLVIAAPYILRWWSVRSQASAQG